MAGRAICAISCFVILIVSTILAASPQEKPIFAIILLDETSAKTSPFGTRSWAVQLLEALVDKARSSRSDFRVRIMKFSFDDESDIVSFQTRSLSPDNVPFLRLDIHTDCFGKTHRRTTVAERKERLLATLCRVLNAFEANSGSKNFLFLISDTSQTLSIKPSFRDYVSEYLLCWLGCRYCTFPTILGRYSEFEGRIHSLFIPIHGFGGAWLGDIARLTGGHITEKEQCIPRMVWTTEEILRDVEDRLSVEISEDVDYKEGGRRTITLEAWLNYDDQKLGIREGITWEECEKIDINTLKATVFLDDKEFGRLEWNQKKGIFVPTYETSFQPELTTLFEYDRNEKVLTLELPCDKPYEVQVTIAGEIVWWTQQKLSFSFSKAVHIPGPVPNVDVAWSKGTDAYILELSYETAGGETSDKRGTVRIEYEHDHFDLIDEKKNPISGDEISFDDTRRTLYLKVKPNLELGPHEGRVTILPNPDCANLKVDNACKFEQDYELTVLKFDREEFTFPNLCFPPDQSHGDSFTVVLGPIRLDGIPKENWNWDLLKTRIDPSGFPQFPEGIPCPEITNIQGNLFDLKLTIASCSALRDFKEAINSDPVDGYLEFVYDDPSKDDLKVFKVSPMPVDLTCREKWIRITDVKNFTEGILHGGDKAFVVSLEYSPDLAAEEKCVEVVFDAQDLELFDEEGTLNESGTISDSEFALRVHRDTSPGRKTGELWLYPSTDADGVYLYRSAQAAQLAEKCRYPQDMDKEYGFEVPYNIEIRNVKLICNIDPASAGETLHCVVSLDLGQGRDAPSSGRLGIQIAVNGLSGEVYLDPPFAGNKQVSVDLSGEIKPPVPHVSHVSVHPRRNGKEFPANHEITVKMTQRPASHKDIKLLELYFDSISPSAEGNEATETLGGNATGMYHPEESEDGPTVELNGSTKPITIPIEATIHRTEAPCRVETTCTSNTLAEDTLRFASSQEREKGVRCGEPISVSSGEDVVSVYAKADTSRGVHDLVLNLNGVNCDLNGDTDIKLRLCVSSPIVSMMERQSRWIALVFFALPMLAFLISWIFYQASGYDSFREYIDELRWRWGKWIYIVPPISVGLAFLASVAWFLAAACVIV